MIALRRSAERHHVQRGQLNAWCTFFPNKRTDPLADGFESLIAFNEGLISPGASFPSLPSRDAEVITYVFEGALLRKDASGASRVTYAGEFQREGAGRGHRETNASRSAWARVFQISLRPSGGEPQPSLETKRFSIAERRGLLCVIASQDGRDGSLRIGSHAQVCSAVLESGRHLAYELAAGSRAWVHVVAGAVRMGGLVLTAGDSAGITDEHAVSLTARGESEILLVGLAKPQPTTHSTGFAP
jgi:redox-sensitive bicupin YhaK (pirin superfamily)